MFRIGFALLFLLFACQPKTEQDECLTLAEWQHELDSIDTPGLEQVILALDQKDSMNFEKGIVSVQRANQQAKKRLEKLGCLKPDSLRFVLDLHLKTRDSLARVWLPGLRPLLKTNLSLDEKEQLGKTVEAMQAAASRQRDWAEQLMQAN